MSLSLMRVNVRNRCTTIRAASRHGDVDRFGRGHAVLVRRDGRLGSPALPTSAAHLLTLATVGPSGADNAAAMVIDPITTG